MLNTVLAWNEEGRLAILMSEVIIFVISYIIYLVVSRLRHTEYDPLLDIGDQGYEVDGIREKENAVPAMMHFIMATFVGFGFWYVLVGFPISEWSQASQYVQRNELFYKHHQPIWDQAGPEELTAMGEKLYSVHCAACHDSAGTGFDGMAANLQEFGTELHIQYVIQNGSKGLGKITPEMPAQYELLDPDPAKRDQAMKDVAAYAFSLSGGIPRYGDPVQGQQIYMIRCMVCHSTDGSGQGPAANIPNFSASLIEYGSPKHVEEVLRHGKRGHIGVMPNFEAADILEPIEYRALGHYVANGLPKPWETQEN